MVGKKKSKRVTFDVRPNVSDVAMMMKSYHVAEISYHPAGGIASMKLHPTAFPPQEMIVQPIDPRVFEDPLKTPANEDEVLFWSAGGSGAQNTNGTDYVPPLVGEQDVD